jgi:programmed cell death protein 5
MGLNILSNENENVNGPENQRREDEQQKGARESILKLVFSSEARQRLTNIRIVKPQIAKLVEDQVIQLVSSGKLPRPMTDDELKKILLNMQQPKKEFKIRRI